MKCCHSASVIVYAVRIVARVQACLLCCVQASSSASNERLYSIELQRGARGFGFSIRGGREFNNMPLFILKIAEGGSAHTDGRLRVHSNSTQFLIYVSL